MTEGDNEMSFLQRRKGYNIGASSIIHTVLICVCVLVLKTNSKRLKKNINNNMVGYGNG